MLNTRKDLVVVVGIGSMPTCVVGQIGQIPQTKVHDNGHANTIDKDQEPEDGQCFVSRLECVVQRRRLRKGRVGIKDLCWRESGRRMLSFKLFLSLFLFIFPDALLSPLLLLLVRPPKRKTHGCFENRFVEKG